MFETRRGDHQHWTSVTHRILECQGCEEVYHQRDRIDSDEYIPVGIDDRGETEWDYDHLITYWPSPRKREPPRWMKALHTIDTELHSLLQQVYIALENDLDVLAPIGIRTSFDRGAELLGIDPAKTFSEKLIDLLQQGFIGDTEKISLEIMTEAGNASAHRGWRPSIEELETMMQIIESFVHRAFILRPDVSKLQNAVPAKAKRRPSK